MNTRTEQDTENLPEPRWVPVLIAAITVLLAGIIAAPLALSGQDIMDWAREGLNLSGPWPWVVFYALDASAAICVLASVYLAWTGQTAGLIRLAVWIIAIMSAQAQYKHGIRVQDTAPDAKWFFPAMAMLGPAMLELMLWKVRVMQLRRKGQMAKETPKFSIWRWIPGIGSFTETYGAWRVAKLLNLSSYERSVQEYRRLCPTGGFRVLAAIRKEQMRPEPVQVQNRPVQASTEPKIMRVQSTRTDDEQYLDIIRKEWPGKVPSGYQLRQRFKINYAKSKKILKTLEEENQ